MCRHIDVVNVCCLDHTSGSIHRISDAFVLIQRDQPGLLYLTRDIDGNLAQGLDVLRRRCIKRDGILLSIVAVGRTDQDCTEQCQENQK